MVDRTITTDLIGRDRLSPAFESAGRSADQAGGKLKAFGKGAAVVGGAAGTAAAGLLAKGFADNMNIEAGNAKLAAQLDLSKGQADKAGKVAGEVYADNWGESTEQINEALRAVDTNLADVGKTSAGTLKAMTEDALILAATFDVDVNSSTAAAGSLIKNGLAKDSTEAFDIITAGFQNGVDKAGDFTDTLTEYSPQFSKLGFDGKYSLDLLSEGLKAGARDTDVIADGFKEFGLRAIDGSKATTDAYKDIGLNAKDTAKAIAGGGPAAQVATQEVLDSLLKIKDPQKQNNAGVALFGTTWEDTVRTILPALANADGAIEKVDGSTKRAGDTIGDTAQGKIDTAKRSFEQWTQSMASSDGALGLVVTSVGEFGGGVLTAGSQLGVMAFALKGTAVAEKGMAVATAILNGGLKVMRVATTLALGPFGLIIIAVAAVAAGLIYLYKHSETFRTIVNGVFRQVANQVLWVADKWLGAFQIMFEVMGKLPGKAGAPFRAAAKSVQGMRDKVNGLRADINRLHGKEVRILVKTEYRDVFDSEKNRDRATANRGRAHGGPVMKGQSYIVGDGGRPELFVPDSDGTILPRVPSSGGGRPYGGGGDIFNIYVTGNGDRQLAAAVVRALETMPAGSRKIPASAVAGR
jgi:phage-related minor tail protein